MLFDTLYNFATVTSKEVYAYATTSDKLIDALRVSVIPLNDEGGKRLIVCYGNQNITTITQQSQIRLTANADIECVVGNFAFLTLSFANLNLQSLMHHEELHKNFSGLPKIKITNKEKYKKFKTFIKENPSIKAQLSDGRISDISLFVPGVINILDLPFYVTKRTKLSITKKGYVKLTHKEYCFKIKLVKVNHEVLSIESLFD